MNQKTLMQIREFSALTGISRDSLRFYDKIGLLSPESRGDNGYRYYTNRQTDLAFLISDLRALGIGLSEIKKYADERSPERMLALFSEQDAHIEKEIERLRSIQELMRLRADIAIQSLKHGKNVVVLEDKEKEPIYLCPPLEEKGPGVDMLVQYYDYAAAQGVNTSFPIGGVIPRQVLECGNWSAPFRCYFKVRQKHNAWKPAGTYAVFYGQWSDEQPEGFYIQLLDFIRDNGLQIEGDAYEEYPLDELSKHEDEPLGVRVEVKVSRLQESRT